MGRQKRRSGESGTDRRALRYSGAQEKIVLESWQQRWSRERWEGRLGGGRAVCRQELGGPAAARPRLPSPSPAAQLGLLRPSSDGELSRGKVEPREPRPTRTLSHQGRRGRPAGWVRAAATGGGSVDSWNWLLEGFALDRGSCRRAAQDPGKRRFPPDLTPHPAWLLRELGKLNSWELGRKVPYESHGATRVKKGSSVASHPFHTCRGEVSEKSG